MPVLSVWFIRLSLGYLVMGTALGAMMLLVKAGAAAPRWMFAGWGVHSEVVLIGWMVQLTMGVGYWILPKFPRQPVRGPLWPAVTALVLLNIGVLGSSLASALAWRDLMVAARMVELMAVISFGLSIWPRVKAFRSPYA